MRFDQTRLRQRQRKKDFRADDCSAVAIKTKKNIYIKLTDDLDVSRILDSGARPDVADTYTAANIIIKKTISTVNNNNNIVRARTNMK